ncbi:prephenate dehydrogenase [Gleimia hominis]|uniref:Prephenate dehydrogenase n=1 Tax=Gleimia hominis TaxID=595468 RepID=A0ABU3IDS7_9ACTO|nr:prephenate dehydrogenase [Gleimia hominis]MDT3767647.1 prephenate dehydrogenase [Gleimia hominis]
MRATAWAAAKNQDGRVFATTGPVLVVGMGLLGTSAALALRGAGIEVYLQDISPTALALARDIGAGEAYGPGAPDPALVIVATPPDVVAPVVVDALNRFANAVVTDVASVKQVVVDEVLAAPVDTSRYVGSHPMAGRERSGAAAADRDLFVGRPWVLVAHEHCDPAAVLTVRTLATDLGASVVEMAAGEHDRAVALVSHVPQLVASLLAARLADAPDSALELAGQGLRDTTRIAASNAQLWTNIICGNCEPVWEVLASLNVDLQALLDALRAGVDAGFEAQGLAGAINQVMSRGHEGVVRIPGKHGGPARRWATIEVLIPDSPGELGRLFSELGNIDVNIEDLTLDHSAHQQVGSARIQIDPARAHDAAAELLARGWRIVTEG